MIEPSPTAPCDGTMVLGRIASNASNAASHAFMLDTWVAARNELFITTSPENSTPSPSTKSAGVAARVRRADDEKPHADAAQIQHVVAIERDVGLAAGGVLQQLGRQRRPAGEGLDLLGAALGELGLLHVRVHVFRRGGKRQVAGRVLGVKMRGRDEQLGVLADLGDLAQDRLPVASPEPGIDHQRRARADDDADVRDERRRCRRE